VGERARRLWTVLEPVHGLVYFSAEVRAVADAAGYTGFWMGYFAFRAAPLGPVGPAVVASSFFGFHPSRVHRALPQAWRAAPPEQALAARLAGADAALRRCWGSEVVESAAVAEAAELAWTASQAADTAGRVLAAANQALPRPDEPHLVLWQAATTLREHRGDGHNAVLVAAGIGPVHAHHIKIAAEETDPQALRRGRAWDDDGTWEQAAADLRDRGWLDTTGQLTAAGAAAHAQIEQQTDAAASAHWEVLGADATDRLAELLTPLASMIIDAGAFPLLNPIGTAAPRPPAHTGNQ
jgi:hypothetical protein